jgi:hypothetical protein
MLNEQQLRAIDLLIEGKLNKVDIAKKVKRSRQWLYESVINNDESKAEVDKRLQEIQNDGMSRIKSNLGRCIDNIIALANNAESDKIKLDANQYLVNRIYGGITTKNDDKEDKEDKDKLTNEDIENEFSKFKKMKKAQ